MRGKIKAMFEKEKTYGITFNGSQWFVGFLNDKPDWLDKENCKDLEVEFDYKVNKNNGSTYYNIVKGSLKKVEAEKKDVEKENQAKSETNEKDRIEYLRERIDTLNKQVLDLSKKLMYEKQQSDQIRRSDIRKQVALKCAVEVVNTYCSIKSVDDINAMTNLTLNVAKTFLNYLNTD